MPYCYTGESFSPSRHEWEPRPYVDGAGRCAAPIGGEIVVFEPGAITRSRVWEGRADVEGISVLVIRAPQDGAYGAFAWVGDRGFWCVGAPLPHKFTTDPTNLDEVVTWFRALVSDAIESWICYPEHPLLDVPSFLLERLTGEIVTGEAA